MSEWRLKYYNSKTNTIDWPALEQCDWIRDMHGVEQDKTWHGEGDVYTHTKMVAEALFTLPEFMELSEEDKHLMVTTALLHDIEKRSTTTIENGIIRCHGHSKKGSMTARVILYKELPAPLVIREEICNLVRNHGLPLHILDREDPDKSVIKTSLVLRNNLLAMISKVDILGRIAEDNPEQLEQIELFAQYCKDNNCYTDSRSFKSNLGRFLYLTNHSNYVDYEPYDETKFKVILMCGIAGAGKDTYINQYFSDWPMVSLDNIRRENGILPTDKKGNGTVVQMAKEAAKVHMRKHENFVWNATNVSKSMREQLIDLFVSYGGYVTVIYVEQPYDKLIQNNRDRKYSVPVDVIEKMIKKLEVPTPVEAHTIILNGT